MTAAEKTDIARFLDFTAANIGSGYICKEPEYNFTDDPDPKITQTQGQIDNVTAGGGPSPLPASNDSLAAIAGEINACTLCRLCDNRKNAVPGEGVPDPVVLVIGDGPGDDEDASGRPFTGRAGQLLDKMLSSIGLSRESNCFITNIIKCRPPANRDPLPDETACCASFLERQVRLLKPRFILCAGRVSSQTILKSTEPVNRLRLKITGMEIAGMEIKVIATYHPSDLLRNEDLKRPAWEDLKMLRSAIETVIEN